MCYGHIQSFSLKFSQKNVIFGTVYFHKIIFESLQNVSETTPRSNELYLDYMEDCFNMKLSPTVFHMGQIDLYCDAH